MTLGTAIAGTIIFAVLVGIVSNVENPALKIMMTVVFYIGLLGFGVVAIIQVIKMICAEF